MFPVIIRSAAIICLNEFRKRLARRVLYKRILIGTVIAGDHPQSPSLIITTDLQHGTRHPLVRGLHQSTEGRSC
jgi:hypothetical protein